MDEWSKFVSPIELVEKLDDYESIKSLISPSSNIDRSHNQYSKRSHNNSKGNENDKNRNSEGPKVGNTTYKGTRVENKPVERQKGNTFRCYGCGEQGHVQSRCPKQNDSNPNEGTTGELEVFQCGFAQVGDGKAWKSSPEIDTQIGDLVVPTIQDTGSELNLLRQDIYEKMRNPPALKKKYVFIKGVTGDKMRSKGYINCKCKIGSRTAYLEFHIVPHVFQCQALLGRDALWQMKLMPNLFKNTPNVRKQMEMSSPSVDMKRSQNDNCKQRRKSIEYNLFVGRLHPTMTEHSLNDYFSKFGPVEDSIVMRDRETGRSRRFGFVKFRDKNCVFKILQMRNHMIDGQRVHPRKYLATVPNRNVSCGQPESPAVTRQSGDMIQSIDMTQAKRVNSHSDVFGNLFSSETDTV